MVLPTYDIFYEPRIDNAHDYDITAVASFVMYTTLEYTHSSNTTIECAFLPQYSFRAGIMVSVLYFMGYSI